MRPLKLSVLIGIAIVQLLVVGCSLHAGPGPDASGSENLERMRLLAGHWTSHPRDGSKPEEVYYRVTSGGSVVVETLFPGTGHEMVSTYFKDNGKLSMTHYCMLQNQPHLIAENEGKDTLHFRFVNGTNINPEHDEFMGDLRIVFLSPDHIHQEWSGFNKQGEHGEPSKVIDFYRD